MIRLCAFSDEAGNSLKEQIEALKSNSISLMELRSIDITIEEAKGISVWSIGSPIGKVDIEVEDDVTAYFGYENGATGMSITTTGETPGNNRLEISGSKGKLLSKDGSLVFYKNEIDSIENSKTSDKGFDKSKCEKVIVETDGENPQHLGILNNFANAILGIEKLFINGIEGINGVELMDTNGSFGS